MFEGYKKVFSEELLRYVIIGIIPLVVSIFSEFFGVKSLVSILNQPFPLWLIVLVFFLGLAADSYRKRLFKESTLHIAMNIPGRSEYEEEIPFPALEVKWLAYIPRPHNPFSEELAEYVRIDGPFCPQCAIKLKGD